MAKGRRMSIPGKSKSNLSNPLRWTVRWLAAVRELEPCRPGSPAFALIQGDEAASLAAAAEPSSWCSVV